VTYGEVTPGVTVPPTRPDPTIRTTTNSPIHPTSSKSPATTTTMDGSTPTTIEQPEPQPRPVVSVPAHDGPGERRCASCGGAVAVVVVHHAWVPATRWRFCPACCTTRVACPSLAVRRRLALVKGRR
jgi:hypothetical protein